MEWYFVVKTINGRRYRYRQKTYRNGTRVRTNANTSRPSRHRLPWHIREIRRFSADHRGSVTDCDSSREGSFRFSSESRGFVRIYRLCAAAGD